MASAGHVRQLPVKPTPEEGCRHGIRVATWEPTFEVEDGKKAVVAKLRAAAKGATVWLASDPDREGEGIAWHLAELLHLPASAPRVKYHEITPAALREAFTHPGRVSLPMVHAQKARQMLDRLVGYDLSPLVGAVIGPNASAGRVQSAALRLVIDRAESLETTDWAVGRTLVLGGTFAGVPTTCDAPFADMTALAAFVDALVSARPVDGVVTSATATVEHVAPPPPFSTSSMQQAASALRMSPKVAMKHAQALFEAGHITYMRTDSTSLSDEAVAALLAAVRERFGDAMACERHHKTRAANAQEAHEAIRPTVPRDAEAVGLDPASDAGRLYDLVYRRALATQMASASFDVVSVALVAGERPWSGQARRLTSKGWKVLYAGDEACDGAGDEAGDGASAAAGRMRVGDRVRLEALSGGEKLPPAPAMYGEASLVKAMEKAGVGRPSTYASTLDKLAEREFVVAGDVNGPQVTLESVAWKAPSDKGLRKRSTQAAYAFKGVLVPTPRGRQALEYLKTKFSNLIDLKFTSSMETALDAIAAGTTDHRVVMTEFARGFDPALAQARADAPKRPSGGGGGSGDQPSFEGGWLAMTNQYGPTLRGPIPADGGRARYVSLNHYLAATKKSVEQLTQADVDFMVSLPRQVGGGHAVADGKTGFYVTGPSVKGDLPDAVVAAGAAVTLASIEAALASKLRRFQIGSSAWVAREGANGPFLQGPPTEAQPDKPHYVDLQFYLGWKGKTLSSLTHDDVRTLSCLPRLVSGYTLGVNQFGFYAKGPDGKYKTLSDDMADRVESLTLVDLQHIPFVPRAATEGGDKGGGRGGGRGRGGRGRGRGARAARDEDL